MITSGTKMQARTISAGWSAEHVAVRTRYTGDTELVISNYDEDSNHVLNEVQKARIYLSPEQAMEIARALIEAAQLQLQEGRAYDEPIDHWNNDRVQAWQQQNRENKK